MFKSKKKLWAAIAALATLAGTIAVNKTAIPSAVEGFVSAVTEVF